MKKICLDSNEVKIAAKSPCFSRIGPEVFNMVVCDSLAIISAKEVFPSPGGPLIRT